MKVLLFLSLVTFASAEWKELLVPESPMQSGTEQMQLRLSAAETPPPYSVKNESFDLLVPATYDKTKPHGLFIWITAGEKHGIPQAWENVLAEHKLITVAARNSGNKRNIFDRMRMAIDANDHLRKIYNIDGRRVYIAGFSGGARVASNLSVAFSEMFSGAICFMGCNFYLPVKADDGKTYGESYLPADELLDIAKAACRYVLMTGEKDFNRANIRAVFDGMEKENFRSVEIFDIPQQGHSLPGVEWLGRAIAFLDEGK
ncbi:MAG: hypothetical protein JNJ83_21900 [Verrucomicrobiaceae bacterium]|nr:hypothetical protein [Verrucomicrobiaceae bacterium]